ncbi:MAG: PIN domain-containing protein [Deltaproteobacteria bacterium]|nr:MAG: PIN domain-containing protein [Deltaproteobacteria bacterium]
MMKSVFLDTNVLLDVLLNREPFVSWAQQIWTLALQRKIKASISSISILNCFYIIKKLKTNDQAYSVIEDLAKIFNIIQIDSKVITNALQTRFEDFEDGIQHQCALISKSKAIITRDEKGFSKSKLPVLDPINFIGNH